MIADMICSFVPRHRVLLIFSAAVTAELVKVDTELFLLANVDCRLDLDSTIADSALLLSLARAVWDWVGVGECVTMRERAHERVGLPNICGTMIIMKHKYHV